MESPVSSRSLPCLLASTSSSSDSTSLMFTPVAGSPPDTLCTLCTEDDLPSRRLSRPSSSFCHGIMAIVSRFRDCLPFSDLASACPTLARCSGTSSDISSPGRRAPNTNMMTPSPPVPLLLCHGAIPLLSTSSDSLGLSYYAGPPTDDQVSSIQVSVS